MQANHRTLQFWEGTVMSLAQEHTERGSGTASKDNACPLIFSDTKPETSRKQVGVYAKKTCFRKGSVSHSSNLEHFFFSICFLLPWNVDCRKLPKLIGQTRDLVHRLSPASGIHRSHSKSHIVAFIKSEFTRLLQWGQLIRYEHFILIQLDNFHPCHKALSLLLIYAHYTQ